MTASDKPAGSADASGALPAAANDPGHQAGVEEGDIALIDDMLARSPEERLACLEEILASLEALIETRPSVQSVFSTAMAVAATEGV